MQNDPTKEKEAQVFWLAYWAAFGKATVLCWALLLFLCVLVDIVGTSSVDIEGVVTGQGIFAVISVILGYGAGTNAVRAPDPSSRHSGHRCAHRRSWRTCPLFRTVDDPGSVEGSYYVWVDWFDALGLGRNIPYAMGNLNDAVYALVNGRLITLRVPKLTFAD